MKHLLKTKLISLLTDASPVTNQEMESAYEGFMEQIETVSQSENIHHRIYRILNNTRVELVFIESLYRYKQGKKCLKICLSSKDNGINQF